MEKLYVAYFRVSSIQQRNSGLGLEAQRSIVQNFIKNNGNKIIASFTEQESGKRDDRPELKKALCKCRENDATLVICRLDRLSRNLTFISQLMDAGVKFVCCDMPEANEFTISIFASLAQQERKFISQRTKDALIAKRKRDNWIPGTDNLTDAGRTKSCSNKIQAANSSLVNRHAFHYISALKEQGLNYVQIADKLNVEGYRTVTSRLFKPQSVINIWNRFSNLLPEQNKTV